MMASRLSHPPRTPPACRSISSLRRQAGVKGGGERGAAGVAARCRQPGGRICTSSYCIPSAPRRIATPQNHTHSSYSCPSHLSGMLISSSTVTGRLTCPLIANSLVPWLFLRPIDENHSGPRRRMVGLTDTVSTLVTAAVGGGRAGSSGWVRRQRWWWVQKVGMAQRRQQPLAGPHERRTAAPVTAPSRQPRPPSPAQRAAHESPSPAQPASPRLRHPHARTGGGAAVQPDIGGEGRLKARLALLALQRLDERGLLATDVGARTPVDVEVKVVAAAARILAEVALGVGLVCRACGAVGGGE